VTTAGIEGPDSVQGHLVLGPWENLYIPCALVIDIAERVGSSARERSDIDEIRQKFIHHYAGCPSGLSFREKPETPEKAANSPA